MAVASIIAILYPFSALSGPHTSVFGTLPGPTWCLILKSMDSNTGPILILIYLRIQAGLVLHQGYVPEKCRTNQTQNSHLKHFISCRLED